MKEIVVGLYDERDTAQEVIDALKDHGIDRDSLHVNSSDTDLTSSRYDNDRLRQQLTGDGVPAGEAKLYAEGVRRGGTLVIAEVDDQQVQEVTDLMKTDAAVTPEDRYDSAFRKHYQTAYGGGDYSTYEPAYRFGRRYSTREEYQGREWTDAAPNIRREYEAQHGEGTFEDVKEAIRYGFSYPRRGTTVE